MTAPRIAKNIAKPVPRQRDGMDAKHLDKVRQCSCAVCGSVPSRGGIMVQAHHLLRTGEHGMGRKSSDRWAIPLDMPCHRALHDAGDEEAYLMRHGIDGRALASALWAVRGKAVEHYQMVVFAHRQRATLKLRGSV